MPAATQGTLTLPPESFCSLLFIIVFLSSSHYPVIPQAVTQGYRGRKLRAKGMVSKALTAGPAPLSYC